MKALLIALALLSSAQHKPKHKRVRKTVWSVPFTSKADSTAKARAAEEDSRDSVAFRLLLSGDSTSKAKVPFTKAK